MLFMSIMKSLFQTEQLHKTPSHQTVPQTQMDASQSPKTEKVNTGRKFLWWLMVRLIFGDVNDGMQVYRRYDKMLIPALAPGRPDNDIFAALALPAVIDFWAWADCGS